jgi:DNA-binding response OmpR family regulator
MAKRVLIVDDDYNYCFTLAQVVRTQGHEVDEAATGEEAVKLCAEQDYNIVLLDVHLLGIDGVETFRRIRQHLDVVRVILMSAHSRDGIMDEAINDGVMAVLDKPVDIEQIFKLIGEAQAFLINATWPTPLDRAGL